MIGPSGNVRVYLACGPTDMRKGFDGLAAAAQEHLRQDPCSGAVFAFRGKRGDRVKLLWWDGQGFLQALGAWPLSLAISGRRHGAADAGAAVDAAGGHRLAAAPLDGAA